MVTGSQIERLKRQLSDDVDEEVKELKNAFDAKESDNFPYKQMISPSMLSIFAQCPKRWELRYKDKNYEPADNLQTLFGIVFHRMVQAYLKDKINKDSTKSLTSYFNEFLVEEANDVVNRFKEEASENRELPFNSQDLASLKEYAQSNFGMLESKILRLLTDNTELFAVEERFEGELIHKLTFSSIIDLALFDTKSDQFEIIDIKTWHASWENQDRVVKKSAAAGLLASKYYFAKNLDIPLSSVKTSFFIFNKESGTAEKINLPSEKSQLKWAIQKLKRFVKLITTPSGYFKENQYSKKPSKKSCSVCPYSTEFNGNEMCDQDGKKFKS